jgi:predicted deacetylase
MRLDDASEYMDEEKWLRMEQLLDKFSIKPIYGIIPHNEDPELLRYGNVDNFWEKMRGWKTKGWTPAIHGYSHVFETKDGGLNPVNNRSEFAGVPLERQQQKIRDGLSILKEHGINPEIFFAPAHTFDKNTLKALETESNIRVISDTIAQDVYYKDGFYFIPQQSGKARKLPFKTVTFCYHPNIMSNKNFNDLENFLIKNRNKFHEYTTNILNKRERVLIDKVLNAIYFSIKSVK